MTQEIINDFAVHTLPKSENPLHDAVLKASWEKGLPKQFSEWIFHSGTARGPRLAERELIFLATLFDDYPQPVSEEYALHGYSVAKHGVDLILINRVLKIYPGPGFFHVHATEDNHFLLEFSYDQLQASNDDLHISISDPLNEVDGLPSADASGFPSYEKNRLGYSLPAEMDSYFLNESVNALPMYVKKILIKILLSGRFLKQMETITVDKVAVVMIRRWAAMYPGAGKLEVLSSTNSGFQVRIEYPGMYFDAPLQLTEQEFKGLILKNVPEQVIEYCFGYDENGKSNMILSERKIVLALLSHAGKTVPYARFGINTDSVKSLIVGIRKKIKKISDTIYVVSMFGEGYRLYLL